MDVIRLMGGLGNEMFQYALYKKLSLLGNECKIDDNWYTEQGKPNYLLDVFDLKYEKSTKEENESFSRRYSNNLTRIKRVLAPNKLHFYYSDKEKHFQEIVLTAKECYLDGYWQSEKYFMGIADELRKDFKFKEELSEYQKEILAQIESSNSVSVHVRRGDYLNYPEYQGICDEDYYKRALKYFEGKDVTFFVFSNDYEYVKEKFKGNNYVCVKTEKIHKGDVHGYSNMDLLLMSKCKHNIIANSSYSWWGAWLNENKDKIVISPSRWQNGHETNDIWCDGWVKI